MGLRLRDARILPIALLALAGIACSGHIAGSTGAGGSAGTGGGAGGTGATGGTGGSESAGGSGGADPGWTCTGEGLPACPGQMTLVAVPDGRSLEIPLQSHTIAQFDYAARVVDHRPIDYFGHRSFTFVPVDSDTPIEFLYRSLSDELDAPVSAGDEVIVRYEETYDDIWPRGRATHALHLHDLQGRTLWSRFYSKNQVGFSDMVHLAGIELWATYPVCFTLPPPGSDLPQHGLEFEVALPGGEPVRASPGSIVELRAADRHARLYVGSATSLDPSCMEEGEYQRNELTLAMVFDEPGVDRPVCASDLDCDGASYCERGARGCEDGGHCAPRPSFCRTYPLQRTVCGCDGHLYQGPCRANAAGVDSVLEDSTTRCDGVFACGVFLCREGVEACVRDVHSDDEGWGQPVPYCSEGYFAVPRPAECDPAVRSCACVGLPTRRTCTCTDVAPGQIEIDCIHE